jgi:hypothetical protein
MTKETGELTSFDDIFGDKLYQQRAREALPILIRQAMVSQKITYSDLAIELKMPNPRNLNFVLGLIGNILLKLSEEWKEDIPPIQSIVVNKQTEMPGEGINWFIKNKKQYGESTLSEKRQLLMEMLNNVFHYTKWFDVLEKLQLMENNNSAITFKKIIGKNKSKQYGSGESEDHKQFKLLISENQKLIGLNGFAKGELEHIFPSLDAIDVYFSNNDMVVGVEVKSKISDVNDILRGLFQCKKYEALIEAENSVNGIRKQIIVILVLENEFPNDLIPIKNVLSVNVIDSLHKKQK